MQPTKAGTWNGFVPGLLHQRECKLYKLRPQIFQHLFAPTEVPDHGGLGARFQNEKRRNYDKGWANPCDVVPSAIFPLKMVGFSIAMLV